MQSGAPCRSSPKQIQLAGFLAERCLINSGLSFFRCGCTKPTASTPPTRSRFHLCAWPLFYLGPLLQHSRSSYHRVQVPLSQAAALDRHPEGKTNTRSCCCHKGKRCGWMGETKWGMEAEGDPLWSCMRHGGRRPTISWQRLRRSKRKSEKKILLCQDFTQNTEVSPEN